LELIPLTPVRAVPVVAALLLSFLAFGSAPAQAPAGPILVTINADHYRHSPGLSFERLLKSVEAEVARLQAAGHLPDSDDLDPYVVERGLKTFGHDVCTLGQYVCGFTAVETFPTVVGPILCVIGIVGLEGVKHKLDKRHIIIRPFAANPIRSVEIRIVNLQKDEAYRLLDYIHYDLME